MKTSKPIRCRARSLGAAALAIAFAGLGLPALLAQEESPSETKTAAGKPNILIIWGDDIGYWSFPVFGCLAVAIQSVTVWFSIRGAAARAPSRGR